MAISVTCEKCGESYRVKDDKAGSRIRCKGCGGAISVPSDDDDFDLDGEAEEEQPARRSGGAKGRKKAAGKAKPSGSNKVVLIAAGGVAAVALIGGLVLFLTSGGDKPNAAPVGAPVAEQSTTPAAMDPAAAMAAGAPAMTAEAHAATPDTAASPMPTVAAPVATTPAVAVAPSVPAGPALSLDDPQVWGEISSSKSQLRDISLAFHTFHGLNKSFVPDPNLIPGLYAPDGRLKLSWRVHLLPALGQVELFNKFNINEAWDSPTNRPLVDQIPDVYRSSGVAAGSTRFMGFSARVANGSQPVSSIPIGGPFPISSARDGTSNTAMVVLAPVEKAVPWTSPEDVPFDPQQPAAALAFVTSNSPVLLVAMMDGRIIGFPSRMSPTEFGQLVNPADGQKLSVAEVPLREAWHFAKPKPGPFALAYLTDKCAAVVTLQPSKLLATDWVTKLLPPGALEQMRRDVAIDPADIEQVVIWFSPDGGPSVAIGMKLSKPVSPATHPKLYRNGRPDFFSHDDRTIIGGPPEGLNAVTAAASTSSSTPDVLRERLGSGEVTHEGRVIVNLRHPIIQKAFNGQGLPGPPNPFVGVILAQFRQSALAQSHAVEVLLTPSGSTLVEISATAPDAALSDRLKKELLDFLNLARATNERDPNAAAVRDILKEITVTQEGLSVRLALTKSNSLIARLAEMSKQAAAGAQQAAVGAQRNNRLKEIGLALHNFESAYRSLPPGDNPKHFNAEGKPHLSWRVHILPFVGQAELFKQFHLDEPFDSPHNAPLSEKMPDLFKSPGVVNPVHTTIVGFSGEGALFSGKKVTFANVADGTSNTIAVIECRPDKAVVWTKPEDLPFNPADPLMGVGPIPPEGLRVVLVDGSVRTLPANISPEVLKALITIAGGEPPQSF